MDRTTRGVGREHFLVMIQVEKFLGHGKGLFDSARSHSMVDDIGKTHGTTSFDKVFGYLLPMIGASICPSSEVHDGNVRGSGRWLVIGLAHC